MIELLDKNNATKKSRKQLFTFVQLVGIQPCQMSTCNKRCNVNIYVDYSNDTILGTDQMVVLKELIDASTVDTEIMFSHFSYQDSMSLDAAQLGNKTFSTLQTTNQNHTIMVYR